jgi:transposase
MKEVTVVKVKPDSIECPYCGTELDGIIGDPRGFEFTCERCGNTCIVHKDADFEL